MRRRGTSGVARQSNDGGVSDRKVREEEERGEVSI